MSQPSSTQANAHKHMETHLLQLKLSPPAGIGISVERRSDAVSNGGGIHGGQAVGPTIASNALRGTSDFGCKRWPEAKRVGGWLSRGPGSRKNLGQNLVAEQVGKGPEMAGQMFWCGFGQVHAVLPQALSAQPAARQLAAKRPR